MLENKDSHQVDEQAGDRDGKETLVMNVRRLQSPLPRAHTLHTCFTHTICVCARYLNSFREDEEGSEDEEESVDEAANHLSSDIPEACTRTS